MNPKPYRQVSNQKEVRASDRFSWMALEKAYATKKKERLMDWGVEQLEIYKLLKGCPRHRALPSPVLFYFLYQLVVKSRGTYLNVQDLLQSFRPDEDSVRLTLRRLWPVVKTLYCQEAARR